MSKRIRIITLLLAILLLSACATSRKSPSKEYIDVYFVIGDDYQTSGSLVQSERVNAGENALDTAVDRLNSGPTQSGFKSPLPAGASISGYFLSPSGELTLNLGRDYLELSGIDKSVADYCLALTFCGIRNVEAVSISVDGVQTTSGLVAEDALLYDTEETPYEKQLNLYFANKDGRYLDIEHRTLTISGDTSLERCVMEELLLGCYSDDLRPAVPEGTRLLAINTEKNVCTVNLSREFLAKQSGSIIPSRLAVYSVVNSLCTLSDVDSVQLLVEGQKIRDYNHQFTSLPLSRNEDLVAPAIAGRGEEGYDVYLALSDIDFLSPIPAKINTAGYASDTWALADKLLNHTEEPTFRQLFPPEGVEFEIRELDRICFIMFYAEDIEWCNSQGTGYLAAQSIIATLAQLKGIDLVSIGCIDGTATFTGLKPSIRYTPYEAIIIR